MALLIPLVFLAYVLLYVLAFSVPPLPFFPLLLDQTPLQKPVQNHLLSTTPRDDFELWLEKEEEVALDRLFANVAPGGRNVPDAVPGTVIASPSREHPNYYFQCMLSCS